MKTLHRTLKARASLSFDPWWEPLRITPGCTVTHPKRGGGVVKFVNADDDGKVHVEFAGGELHRYVQRSWSKFTHFEAAPAAPVRSAAADAAAEAALAVSRRTSMRVAEAMAMVHSSSGDLDPLYQYLRFLDGAALSELLIAPADGIPHGSMARVGGRKSMSAVAMTAMAGAGVGATFCDALCVRLRKTHSEDEAERCIALLTAKERLGGLTNAAKARLIRSIAHAWDELTGESALAVLRVFESARGADLDEVKELFEEGCVDGGAFDLSWLIFKRLDDETRLEVLQSFISDHVLREARRDAAGTTPRSGQHPFQLLSDIDDTFYCSFLDRRVPRHTVYPGVTHFYRELQRGQGKRDLPVFLSARPRGFNGAGAVISIKQLQGKMGAMGLTSKRA